MEFESVKFTARDRSILESYKTVCEGLADYLGEGYEIVLHSLESFDTSVIKIINGYHTGREEGAPITDLALRMLEDIRNNEGSSYISYNSVNKKGEPMHSTTIAISGDKGKIIGLLCINFYLNTPLSAAIKNIIGISEDSMKKSENFAETSASVVDETIAAEQYRIMNSPEVASVDKNKVIISNLYEKGIFKFKDSVAKCADALGISRNTVYMHIRNCK